MVGWNSFDYAYDYSYSFDFAYANSYNFYYAYGNIKGPHKQSLIIIH